MKTKITGFKKRYGSGGVENYAKTRKLKDYEIGYNNKQKFFIETKDDLFENSNVEKDMFSSSSKLKFEEK